MASRSSARHQAAPDSSVQAGPSASAEPTPGLPFAGVLVVGYGNPLRGDDGVGPAVAERLAADPRLRDADVRVEHQLTPELALDASRVALLVLVDAAEDVPPGEVAVRELVRAGAGEAADRGSADGPGVGAPPLTHHVDPPLLLDLAAELWGSSPRTVIVGVGPASLELGEALTPLVAAAVPRAVEAVVAVVSGAAAAERT